MEHRVSCHYERCNDISLQQLSGFCQHLSSTLVKYSVIATTNLIHISHIEDKSSEESCSVHSNKMMFDWRGSARTLH